MSTVTMRQLLEAGVHFGHQTRRWNPKMKRFIHSERNGIYIIDLQQTIGLLETAYDFVRDTVAKGGTVLFVGTKKQAQEAVEQQALRVNMPYVNFRWLGGMLTNFETIKSRLGRLRELGDMETDGRMEVLPKKEALSLRREREKLERNLGGIRGMNKLPDAVWVVDTVKEHIAVREANRLGIPVVAVVDTNCDPDEVQYAIPGNDDAIRSGALLTRLVADACAEGYQLMASRSTDDVVAEQAAAAAAAAETVAAPVEPQAEPLAEWEIALRREEAARQAAQAVGPDDAPSAASDPGPQDVGQTAADTAAATDDTAAATEPSDTRQLTGEELAEQFAQAAQAAEQTSPERARAPEPPPDGRAPTPPPSEQPTEAETGPADDETGAAEESEQATAPAGGAGQ
jgi:small subunit ribosomal protein S2